MDTLPYIASAGIDTLMSLSRLVVLGAHRHGLANCRDQGTAAFVRLQEEKRCRDRKGRAQGMPDTRRN